MKLVVYMYKKFFGTFFASMIFFVLILGLTDLFINLWNYISKGVDAKTVGKILLYYIPKSMWYAVPIAVLFSTSYMLSDLYAKNELLAIFASGISLLRFTFPLLIVSILMSFGLFFFEDNVVVDTYAKKMSMQQSALMRTKSLNSQDIVVMSEEGRIVYKAGYYDNELVRLYTVYIIFRNEDNSLDRIAYADSALWDDERKCWELSGEVVYGIDEDGDVRITHLDEEHLLRINEEPSTFRNNTVSVEEVNTREAREYIDHLKKAGFPSAEEESQYHKKFAFPFVVFIVVFLAIGLSGKTRKNVLIISLALCIAAVVLFYVMQMITMIMAKYEVIGPFMGAWFPVIFFIVVSAILLRFART